MCSKTLLQLGIVVLFFSSCVEEKKIRPLEITIVKNDRVTDKATDKFPEFIGDMFYPLVNSNVAYISGFYNKDGLTDIDCFQPEIYITDVQSDSSFKITLPKDAVGEIQFYFGTYTYVNILNDYEEFLSKIKAGDYPSMDGLKSNNTNAKKIDYDYLYSKKYLKNNDNKKFNNIDSLRQTILQTIKTTDKIKYIICYECGPSCTGELVQLEKDVNNIIQSFKTFDRCGWDGPNPKKNLSKEYINIYKEIKPYKEKSEILLTQIKKLNEENNPQVCDTITELKKIINLFNTKYFTVMSRICEPPPPPPTCLSLPIKLEFDEKNGQLYSNYEASNIYSFQISKDDKFKAIIKEGMIEASNTGLRFPITDRDNTIIKEIQKKSKNATHFYRFKVTCKNKNYTDYSNYFELSEACLENGCKLIFYQK